MRIHRTKSRIKIGISCIIALGCMIGICYSGYKILEWLKDSHETKATSEEIEEVAEVEEKEDNGNRKEEEEYAKLATPVAE